MSCRIYDIFALLDGKEKKTEGMKKRSGTKCTMYAAEQSYNRFFSSAYLAPTEFPVGGGPRAAEPNFKGS